MARNKNQISPYVWGSKDAALKFRQEEASQTRLKLLHQFRQSHYASQKKEKTK